MLAEVAVYLATSCPPEHRRLGYLRGAVALWSRANRCAAAWAPHYARCHAVVDRAVAGLTRRRKALVLGSGLARDIPLDRLVAAFESVVLVDVVHLAPLRWRLRRLANVACVSADVTGQAAWLTGRAAMPDDPLGRFAADPAFDLVISANALSQLPIGARLAAESGRTRRVLDDAFYAGLVAGHLAALARFRCRVCLLTDVEARWIAPDGRVLDRLDLLLGHRLPPGADAWDWTVAPRGEEDAGHAVVHAARGYADLARAVASAADTGLAPAARHD